MVERGHCIAKDCIPVYDGKSEERFRAVGASDVFARVGAINLGLAEKMRFEKITKITRKKLLANS
jgi:hypothetical protein